ncbi:hypothetical protein JJD41_18235 [Oxynema sp. CENA135]|uniref:hypothetical protein n=1 Tax=Oxynema sp. CENA135 TaxID=984206 RepID=UPI00190B61EC|nr:hypothetical protein [Oxynema sp. CENA135]MBK4731791.1 hypothetical protein [Oxynema sp. CENA135]
MRWRRLGDRPFFRTDAMTNAASLARIPGNGAAAKDTGPSFGDRVGGSCAASPDRSENERDGDIDEAPPPSLPVQFVPTRFM